MGVQIHQIEINLPAVTPSRIYQASVFDFVTLAVIIMPQLFKQIDLIRGDGGAGSIRILRLHEGISPVDTIKERVKAIDEEKLFYSFVVLQGAFPKGVKKIQNNMIFKANADGTGTIIKRKSYFYTAANNPIDESVLKAIDEQAIGLFKAFEAYLVANPYA